MIEMQRMCIAWYVCYDGLYLFALLYSGLSSIAFLALPSFIPFLLFLAILLSCFLPYTYIWMISTVFFYYYYLTTIYYLLSFIQYSFL